MNKYLDKWAFFGGCDELTSKKHENNVSPGLKIELEKKISDLKREWSILNKQKLGDVLEKIREDCGAALLETSFYCAPSRLFPLINSLMIFLNKEEKLSNTIFPSSFQSDQWAKVVCAVVRDGTGLSETIEAEGGQAPLSPIPQATIASLRLLSEYSNSSKLVKVEDPTKANELSALAHFLRTKIFCRNKEELSYLLVAMFEIREEKSAISYFLSNEHKGKVFQSVFDNVASGVLKEILNEIAYGLSGRMGTHQLYTELTAYAREIEDIEQAETDMLNFSDLYQNSSDYALYAQEGGTFRGRVYKLSSRKGVYKRNDCYAMFQRTLPEKLTKLVMLRYGVSQKRYAVVNECLGLSEVSPAKERIEKIKLVIKGVVSEDIGNVSEDIGDNYKKLSAQLAKKIIEEEGKDEQKIREEEQKRKAEEARKKARERAEREARERAEREAREKEEEEIRKKKSGISGIHILCKF